MSLANHDKHMAMSISAVAKKYSGVLRTNPYVSSMTVGFWTNFEVLSPPHLRLVLKRKPFREFSVIKEPKKPFLNCIFLSILGYESNITAKVFLNGSLSITGPKTFAVAHDVANKICDALTKSVTIHKKIICIERMDIQMINTSLEFDKNFFLDRAFIVAKGYKTPNVSVFYEKQKHKGIVFKVKTSETRTVTLFLFKSGSIVATGVKSPNEFLIGVKAVMGQAIKLAADDSASTSEPIPVTKAVKITSDMMANISF